MSAFHLTLLGLTQSMNLNAFLRSSHATQCQSVKMRSISFYLAGMGGYDHVAC